MRRLKLKLFCIVCVVNFVCFFPLYRRAIVRSVVRNGRGSETQLIVKPVQIPLTIDKDNEEINIVTVICGFASLHEAVVMIKSAIMFLRMSRLRFIILSDFNIQHRLRTHFQNFQRLVKTNFSYHLQNLSFPEEDTERWRTMDKRCATQMLFLPDALAHINRALYVDTDVLFLKPLPDVWLPMHSMNSSHLVGLVFERNQKSLSPNKLFYGFNSGVVYMNLSEMRRFNWTSKVQTIYSEYNSRGLYNGDQGIMNALLHLYPDKVYALPCVYNYRLVLCRLKDRCAEALDKGVALLHGVSNGFQTNGEISLVYQFFAKYQLNAGLDANISRHLMERIEGRQRCQMIMKTIVEGLVGVFDKHR